MKNALRDILSLSLVAVGLISFSTNNVADAVYAVALAIWLMVFVGEK